MKRLQTEAQVWEKNLQRALEREHEARRQVEELTDTIEHLQARAAPSSGGLNSRLWPGVVDRTHCEKACLAA